MSLSAYSRIAIEERYRKKSIFRKADFEALADIHGQIRQAGVNINQVLHNMYLWQDGLTKREPNGEQVTASSAEITEAIKTLRLFMNKFSA